MENTNSISSYAIIEQAVRKFDQLRESDLVVLKISASDRPQRYFITTNEKEFDNDTFFIHQVNLNYQGNVDSVFIETFRVIGQSICWMSKRVVHNYSDTSLATAIAREALLLNTERPKPVTISAEINPRVESSIIYRNSLVFVHFLPEGPVRTKKLFPDIPTNVPEWREFENMEHSHPSEDPRAPYPDMNNPTQQGQRPLSKPSQSPDVSKEQTKLPESQPPEPVAMQPAVAKKAYVVVAAKRDGKEVFLKRSIDETTSITLFEWTEDHKLALRFNYGFPIEEITALVNGLSIPGNVVTLCVIPAAS